MGSVAIWFCRRDPNEALESSLAKDINMEE